MFLAKMHNLLGPITFIPSITRKSEIPFSKYSSEPGMTILILFFLQKLSIDKKLLVSILAIFDTNAIPAFPGEQ